MYEVYRIMHIVCSICFQPFLCIYKHVCMYVFFNLNGILLHVLFWFMSLMINKSFAKPYQIFYMKYLK